MILILAIGFGYLAAGWAGIELVHGWGWGLIAFLLAVGARFTLPISYGVFLCATKIWGWHWFFAICLAFPVLALMMPGILAGLIAQFSSGRR